MVIMAVMSVAERERRATRVAVALAMALPIPYLVVGFALSAYAAATVVLATAIAAVLFLIPAGRPRPFYDETPAGRIDERQVQGAGNRVDRNDRAKP